LEIFAPTAIDICHNAHHAQQNIMLVSAAGPSASDFSAGGLEDAGTVEIEVREIIEKVGLLESERDFLVTEGIAKILDDGSLVLAAAPDWPIQAGGRDPAEAYLRARGESGERIRLEVDAVELVPVELRVVADDDPGVVRIFDIVQRVERGEIVGALRVLTVAGAPSEGKRSA
jgi:hypothetical protein